jgi:Winged helix DNA-binding domain
MTPDKVLRLRLANQALSGTSFRKPEDVVAWFGAVQAQDYLASLWALGLRTRGATEASVEAAEARRAIVRTWPMRGTLHFVTSADARWMTQLLAPRVIARNAARLKREVDVDGSVAARARGVLERILEGGVRRERGEIYAALDARGIGTANSRGLHILLWLALEGTICLAGRQGKQHTFALLDEWIPKTQCLERDEALVELARRYMTSHGPATQRDFMWWAGITAKDAQTGIDGAKSRLIHERVGGDTYWWREARGACRAGTAPLVKLLPAFDEYTVAYRDRSLLVANRRPGSAFGLLGPVIVIDGRVGATWKRTLSRDRAVIQTRLLRPLTRTERQALERAVHDYGEFLGMEAQLVRKSRQLLTESDPAPELTTS